MPLSLASVDQRNHAFHYFRRYCDSMFLDYEGEQDYINVCQAIVSSLLTNMDLPLTNPEHPYLIYASNDHEENVDRLRSIVFTYVQPGFERQLVNAFFHPHGSQRDTLERLMNEYYDMVDASVEDDDDMNSQTTLSLSEHYEQ